MTNGVGWACRFKTGVATVVEAAMKKVEINNRRGLKRKRDRSKERRKNRNNKESRL